jgi:hypothetical protein
MTGRSTYTRMRPSASRASVSWGDDERFRCSAISVELDRAVTTSPDNRNKTRGATGTLAEALTPEEGEKPGLERLVQAAIPIGIGVIIATFVALGIQGDVFTRLLRNYPNEVAVALALAVTGIILPLFTNLSQSPKVKLGGSVIGAVLIVVGVVVAIVYSLASIGDREQPSIEFDVGDTDAAGNVPVTITSSGLSLRTIDHMLLRVKGFDESVTESKANRDCRDTSKAFDDTDIGRLLYLGESGPTSTGSTTGKIEVTVNPAELKWLCAIAVLSERDADRADDDRFTSSLLDLESVPQPSASPGG